MNAFEFLFQLTLPPPTLERFLATFALIPARYFGTAPPASILGYLPFVSDMFLHGEWLHLILNMWTLWMVRSCRRGSPGNGSFCNHLPCCRDRCFLCPRDRQHAFGGTSPWCDWCHCRGHWLLCLDVPICAAGDDCSHHLRSYSYQDARYRIRVLLDDVSNHFRYYDIDDADRWRRHCRVGAYGWVYRRVDSCAIGETPGLQLSSLLR